MAILSIGLNPFIVSASGSLAGSTVISTTLNAATYYMAGIGSVFIPGGGSKTISSAGGAIYWQTQNITFASGSTNVRVGLQDVAGTGLPDLTYDVYVDHVGGSGTIVSNTFNVSTMSTGSKTLTHGDVVAFVVEMTARGGSDSVIASTGAEAFMYTGNPNYPYRVSKVASTTRVGTSFICNVKFDDGTFGYIGSHPTPICVARSTTTFGSTSTPDEYGAGFTLSHNVYVCGFAFSLGSLATTDLFDWAIYSNPLSDPQLIATGSIDPDFSKSPSSTSDYHISTPITYMQAGVEYCISIIPTTSNTIALHHFNLQSASYKDMTYLKCKYLSRTNGTGNFSEVSTTQAPEFALAITAIENGQTPTTNIIGIS